MSCLCTDDDILVCAGGGVTPPGLLCRCPCHRPVLRPAFAGAIRDVAHAPSLYGLAHRTKECGAGARGAVLYIEAALQDAGGRAVRVWMSTRETDAPADCLPGFGDEP